MAVSYLHHHFGREFWDWDIPFVQALDRSRTEKLLRIIERGINCPLTSSTGRLFDAVAAIAGVRQQVNYEAQAAIELEAALEETARASGYPFAVREESGGWIVDTRPMFLKLAQDLRAGVSTGVISYRFHLGFVDVLARIADLVRTRTGLDRVCLSGGSFQNCFLACHLQQHLEARGFRVSTQAEVPCGDGGLSLGQAVIAAHRSWASEE
jgi:hydrogenase maturation protein HypF